VFLQPRHHFNFPLPPLGTPPFLVSPPLVKKRLPYPLGALLFGTCLAFPRVQWVVFPFEVIPRQPAQGLAQGPRALLVNYCGFRIWRFPSIPPPSFLEAPPQLSPLHHLIRKPFTFLLTADSRSNILLSPQANAYLTPSPCLSPPPPKLTHVNKSLQRLPPPHLKRESCFSPRSVQAYSPPPSIFTNPVGTGFSRVFIVQQTVI